MKKRNGFCWLNVFSSVIKSARELTEMLGLYYRTAAPKLWLHGRWQPEEPEIIARPDPCRVRVDPRAVEIAGFFPRGFEKPTGSILDREI